MFNSYSGTPKERSAKTTEERVHCHEVPIASFDRRRGDARLIENGFCNERRHDQICQNSDGA
jgi:hypothetical protein